MLDVDFLGYLEISAPVGFEWLSALVTRQPQAPYNETRSFQDLPEVNPSSQGASLQFMVHQYGANVRYGFQAPIYVPDVGPVTSISAFYISLQVANPLGPAVPEGISAVVFADPVRAVVDAMARSSDKLPGADAELMLKLRIATMDKMPAGQMELVGPPGTEIPTRCYHLVETRVVNLFGSIFNATQLGVDEWDPNSPVTGCEGNGETALISLSPGLIASNTYAFRIDLVNPASQTSSNFWTMTLLEHWEQQEPSDHFAKPIPSFPLWAFPEISVSTFARNSAPSCYLGDCVGAGQGIALPIQLQLRTQNTVMTGGQLVILAPLENFNLSAVPYTWRMAERYCLIVDRGNPLDGTGTGDTRTVRVITRYQVNPFDLRPPKTFHPNATFILHFWIHPPFTFRPSEAWHLESFSPNGEELDIGTTMGWEVIRVMNTFEHSNTGGINKYTQTISPAVTQGLSLIPNFVIDFVLPANAWLADKLVREPKFAEKVVSLRADLEGTSPPFAHDLAEHDCIDTTVGPNGPNGTAFRNRRLVHMENVMTPRQHHFKEAVDQGNGCIIEFPLTGVSKVYRIVKTDERLTSMSSTPAQNIDPWAESGRPGGVSEASEVRDGADGQSCPRGSQARSTAGTAPFGGQRRPVRPLLGEPKTNTGVECEELAVGLQAISLHCVMLLGRAAHLSSEETHLCGPASAREAGWSKWWSSEIQDAAGGQIQTQPLVMCQEPVPVPKVIETAQGLQLAPAAEEFIRLEGHQWRTHWEQGSLRVVASLCTCFLVDGDGERLASPQSFSRASARRFPFYVDSVQTGARLELSVVPALKTRSGDPDLLDAEQLAELLGREQTAPTGEELESNISEMGQDLEKQVHRQLGMVIGCEDEFLRITATSTEAETPNRMVAFVLIHPAVLQAGKEDPKEFIDPQMPLQWFRRLESELARMAKNQVLRVSLFLLKNDHPPVVTPTPTPATARRASSIPGDLGLALDQLRERLHSKEGGPDERRRSIEVQRRRSHQARRATVAELASGGLRLEELRRHSEALPRESEPQSWGPTEVENDSRMGLSPVQRAVLGFRPTTEQMAKRLCDLVLRGAVKAVENLLLRWHGSPLSILSRSPCGQSALDLSVKSCNYHMTFALLKHLPPELPENLVELLNGHNPVTGHSLLYAAVRFSNRHTQQVVRELVLRRADLNAPGSSPSPQSECALACCVRRADVALVEQLLAQQAAVDAWGDDGQTVLQIAVARGSEDILSSLLYGPVPCDPNLRDRYGRTALMMALQKDRRPPYSLVYQLLIASAEVETSDLEGKLGVSKRQPLSYAVGLGDSEPLRALLNRQADPNAVARPRADPKGRLLHAAAEARDEVLIRCLIEARADVTLEGKHGRSLLHLAVGLELSEDTLALILAHRGDPNASCGLRAGGETALRLAVQAPSGKGAELLLHARVFHKATVDPDDHPSHAPRFHLAPSTLETATGPTTVLPHRGSEGLRPSLSLQPAAHPEASRGWSSARRRPKDAEDGASQACKVYLQGIPRLCQDRPAEHERGGPDSRSSLDQVSEDVEIPPMRRNKSKRIAFVSFVKASEAKAALEEDENDFEGSTLKVQLSRANAATEDAPASASSGTGAGTAAGSTASDAPEASIGTKVFVTGFGKDCTENDLTAHFSKCGKLESVSMPVSKQFSWLRHFGVFKEEIRCTGLEPYTSSAADEKQQKKASAKKKAKAKEQTKHQQLDRSIQEIKMPKKKD
eukprot:g31642.t1